MPTTRRVRALPLRKKCPQLELLEKDIVKMVEKSVQGVKTYFKEENGMNSLGRPSVRKKERQSKGGCEDDWQSHITRILPYL
jgi:hypothetical protein